jgi:hypothetical protein
VIGIVCPQIHPWRVIVDPGHVGGSLGACFAQLLDGLLGGDF